MSHPNLNPYPAYKDSGVEWLGQIPAHWEVMQLRRAIMFQRGHDLPTDAREEGDVPVVSSAGISAAHSNAIARAPGIVTGRTGTIGQFHLIDQDYWPHNTTLYSIDLHENAPRFLQYLLIHVSPRFLMHAVKTAVPCVDRNDVHADRTAVPPVSEQRAIASFLDRETARIDALVAKKERLIELLREKRAALISQAVTRGLDPNVRLRNSGAEWLGQIPAHWEVKRLKAIARIRYGLGQPPPESLDGLPLIRATNVDHGRLNEKDLVYVDPTDVPKSRNAFLSAKEIIVVRSGAYTADSAIIPKAYEGAVTGYDLVVTVTKALPEFVAMVLLCVYVRDDQLVISSMRAAQPHLNAEELGSAVLLLPPLSEQPAIADYLDRETARIDALVEKVREVIERLKELRAALISAAVTGKIDVRERAA